jgi:hypothetical protein
MKLKTCATLPTGNKLLTMLLIACSVFCTTTMAADSQYETFIEAEVKPESITHSEATAFFVNNQKYFTNEQKVEFLHKIGTMDDDNTSPTMSPTQEERKLRGISGTFKTYPMQFTKAAQNAKAPASSVQAMQMAMESAEKAVEYLQTLTTSIIDSATQAKQEIAQWKEKIAGLAEQSLEEYVVKVAEATVLLNSSSTEARNLMRDMLDLVTIAVEDMRSNMNDDDALKESVINAQIIMGVQMEVTANRLEALEIKVLQAQADFVVVADMSELFANIITDNLNNKDGYIDKRAESMRAQAYGGCAVCVLMPSTCPICYGVAAAIVETQIKELKEDLKSTKNALKSIRGHFNVLQIKCNDLAIAAATEYDNMNKVKINLQSSHKLIVATDSLPFWRNVVFPRLKSLQTLLENTLATTLETGGN